MSKTRRIVSRFLLGAAVLIGAGQYSLAQMLDPSIDRDDEPFCYYSEPTDVIGVMDARQGTLVTPEGYFYTGYGELMLFTGNPPEPAHQRVKTLLNGYLPVIQYRFTREGIEYSVEAFAATLDGAPESTLMNFIRITVKNTTASRRTAYLGAGIRYQNEANTTWGVGDNRFGRPAVAKNPGEYEQAGVEFSREWEYAFAGDALLRDSSVMYLFPTTPKPRLMMTLKTGYNERQSIAPEKLYVIPTTPVGIVNYELPLEAGEASVIDLKMPYAPLPVTSPEVEVLRTARFDDYLQRTEQFWKKIFSRGIDISVDEPKAVNTFKANLVYDLIARNKIDSFYVQKVNDFQYHAFWLRDASYIVQMYDLTGYHDIAAQCLDFFPRWQQPDGNFLSQGGQFDGWGQTMWAYGQHYRRTHDKAFAERVFPAILRAFEWLKNARRSDPYHIVPRTTPGDNEDISGHVTGHNFWALAGLKNMALLADGIGKKKDAEAFRDEYADLRKALLKRIKVIAPKDGGAIPPGLDSLGGQDWGNMLSVYPEEILDPHDPLVTATLDMTRKKYQEGIMTYGNGRWLVDAVCPLRVGSRGDPRLVGGCVSGVRSRVSLPCHVPRQRGVERRPRDRSRSLSRCWVEGPSRQMEDSCRRSRDSAEGLRAGADGSVRGQAADQDGVTWSAAGTRRPSRRPRP